jgi:hypothetical protein
LKTISPRRTLSTFFLVLSVYFSQAQCTISSSCGYNIDVFIKPIAVVPSSNPCPWGYNYNITFAYTVTTSGVNNCYNDNFGLQPKISCNGQSNDYYTLNVAAPTVGAPASNSSVSGTVTTSTNPYNSNTDCASATPQSLNCNSLQISIYGPGISSGTYPCSFSTLPVELLSFSSLYQNNRVILNWITVTEKNNAYFAVERSNDGLNWTLVKILQGAGTSAVINSYQTEDTQYNTGINYYRLKQVDLDGKYKYSEISVVNTSAGYSSLNYFPNPFTNTFTVDTDSDENKQVTISNELGQVVFSGIMNKRIDIDFSSQPTGLYFVTLKTGARDEHFKMIKQ